MGHPSFALVTALLAATALAHSPSVSGDVRFGAAPAALAQDKSEASYARAFSEATKVLETGISVDVVPGETGGERGVIAKGRAVTSVAVHFDPPADGGSAVITGTLTFDEPVLGVISTDELLAASDGELALATVSYPSSAGRGLEAQDQVSVDSAGTTVTIQMTSEGTQSVDELRIVLGASTEPASCQCAQAPILLVGLSALTQRALRGRRTAR